MVTSLDELQPEITGTAQAQTAPPTNDTSYLERMEATLIAAEESLKSADPFDTPPAVEKPRVQRARNNR
jgi:hypothetical protein